MVIYARFSGLWTRAKMRWSDVKNFFFQIWTYYIPFDRKFYAEQKFQKNLCLEMKWKKVMGHTRSFFTDWRKILDVFSRFLDRKRVSYRNSYKNFSPSDLRGYPSYFFFKLTLLTISIKNRCAGDHGHGPPVIRPY